MDCIQCLEHEWLKMELELPSAPKSLNYKINDLNSISDLDEEKNVNFEDETDKSCATTTSPFSSIASLIEVTTDSDKDDKIALKNSLPDLDEINNCDSGFGGNICDTNINVDLTVDENKSNAKIGLIKNDSIIDNEKENDNQKKTDLSNGLEQMANKYYHHKRLSSDTLSNCRFIAVVSSTLLSTKKFTSESSMFITESVNITNKTIDNQEQKCIKRLPLITLSSSQNLSKNVDVNTIQSSSENSPPSTPSKKIYLSNDDHDYQHYIEKYLSPINTGNTNSQKNQTDLNSPRRIRSMERLDNSSLNYNQTLLHHNDTSITFPLATLTTATTETFHDKRIDSFSSTNIKTASPIIVNNKSEGFHITIKNE